MSKVEWRCVVPGCKSNSSVLRHRFPKDLARSQKWLDIIGNRLLDGLSYDELTNRRICALHFTESSYKITAVRRVLKDDAIPEERLQPLSTSPVTALGIEEFSTSSTKNTLIDVLVPKEKVQSLSTTSNKLKIVSILRINTTANPAKSCFADKTISEKIFQPLSTSSVTSLEMEEFSTLTNSTKKQFNDESQPLSTSSVTSKPVNILQIDESVTFNDATIPEERLQSPSNTLNPGPDCTLRDSTPPKMPSWGSLRPKNQFIQPEMTVGSYVQNRKDMILKIRNQIREDQYEGIDIQTLRENMEVGWNILPSEKDQEKDLSTEKESVENSNLQNVTKRQKVDTSLNNSNNESSFDSKLNESSSSYESDTSSSSRSSSRPLLGGITRKRKLTPIALRLHGIATNLLKKQSKYIHKLGLCKDRLENAGKYMKTLEMGELKKLTKEQLNFLEMHIRNAHKKAQARRFTVDDKVLALAIFKQSAQCYRLLSRIFILPTPRSLRLFMHKISLKPGVNKLIFDHLKEQGKSMTEEDKVCFLLWDEVALDSQIYYDEKEDKVVGFEDWGNSRSNKFADHALVFMLRGINRNWKIPLTYNFCKAATSGVQLMRCVKEIVRAVTDAGFKIVATVCDQGGPNVTCINGLLKETQAACARKKKCFTGRIELSGQEIIPLFDPPHLIKGIRNNFITKNIEILFPNSSAGVKKDTTNYNRVKPFLLTPEFIEEINKKSSIEKDFNKKTINVKEIRKKDPGKGGIKKTNRYFASWKVVEVAYDIDTQSFNTIKKQMPKLTDGHVRKSKIQKMRVYPAVQVLSRTVAAYIRHLTDITGSVNTVEGPKKMPKKEGVTTSEAVKFFNDAFDSLNGRKQDSKQCKNDLRREVSANSCHSIFWKEAASCIANNVQFVNPTTKRKVNIPSLNNFRSTLLGFQRLWQQLQKLKFTSFSPRNINQDPLENFFGMIRSHGCRNIKPTCSQFASSFKSLLINNLTSAATVKGNCENDEATPLFALKNLVEVAQSCEEADEAVAEESKEEFIIFDSDSNQNKTDIYVPYKKVLCKLISTTNCCCCLSDIQKFCQSDSLFKEIHNNLEANISTFCFKKEIVRNLVMPLSLVVDLSSITCEEHKDTLLQQILKLMAIAFVKRWCQKINKLLKGKDSGARVQNFLTKAAREQFLMTLNKENRHFNAPELENF